jgi:hypothetical protein
MSVDLSKVRKLLSLGLNKGAHPGEVQNSALMLMDHLRRAAIGPEEVAGVIAAAMGNPSVPNPIVHASYYCGNVIVNFGKYRGLSIGEIFEADAGYLEWMLTADRIAPLLRQAIERFLKEEVA